MHEVARTPGTLRRAIARARGALLRTQLADGSWDDHSDVGPISTAMVLVSLHWLGRLDEDDRREGARWLRAQQRADGSFLGRPFADRGDLGATAASWAALSIDDTPESRAAAARARAWIDEKGGPRAIADNMRTGDVSALFCALAGVLDARLLPDLPLAWALVPGAVELLAKRIHFGAIMGALQTSLLARRLRGAYGRDGRRVPFLARREHARALELLRLFHNADGSMNGNTVQTALLLPALHAAGLDVTSDPIERGVRWLLSRRVRTESGLWFDVFASDVWSTAFTVRALLRSGMPPGDARIERALEWLVSRQLDVPQPWPNQRRKDAVRTGGWPFQSGNETMADADDAGIVLSAFGLALREPLRGEPLGARTAARVRASIARARPWLRSMQNPDGGWSAFVWGLPARTDGPIMTRPLDLPPGSIVAMARALLHPPAELCDPSTEDLTGRVLHGLGAIGATQGEPEVARAIAFLRRFQTDEGAFWGRWVCNYLASTSYVLSALVEIGEDPSQEHVRRALRFLLSRQNADGGFGESIESYRDPARAGRGPSTAPLTALVVCALVDAGAGDRDETRRAIEYLLAKQRPDGTWPNDDYLATNIPPDGFYVYEGAARHMPLEALGRYARRHEPGVVRPPESWGRWTSAILDPARARRDPLADEVVDEIFSTGRVAAVNALLRKIFDNDDPVPADLPPRARRYFEETAALPPFADPARIRRAQKLFEDHGVQITFGLFCSSLPQAYAAANGALVLTQTAAMLSRTRQRIMETAQFLFDVLDVGGLDANGRGIRSAQRVRLMHAGVRRLILERKEPAWDHATLGMPINQEDLAGTLMTFSVVTFDAMRRLGVEASDAEGDDWIHLWAVVGHFLGIERALVPDGLADARDLMEAIRERQWAESAQGAELAAALCATMQELFTRNALDGLAPTLVRFLAGDQCADLLDLPRSDWTRALAEVGSALAGALDPDDREGVLEHAFGLATREAMRVIVDLDRDHKRASFRIPESLRRTVVPGT